MHRASDHHRCQHRHSAGPGDRVDSTVVENADLRSTAPRATDATYRFFEAGMDQRARARRNWARAASGDPRRHRDLLSAGGHRGRQGLILRGAVAVAASERGMISPAEFADRGRQRPDQPARPGCSHACAEATTGRIMFAAPTSRRCSSGAVAGVNVAAALALRPSRQQAEPSYRGRSFATARRRSTYCTSCALGVRIALDDFGTVFLAQLPAALPVRQDQDRSPFIRDIAGRGASSSIVQAVVNIAAASDMTTTAEGVETEQQRNLLHI